MRGCFAADWRLSTITDFSNSLTRQEIDRLAIDDCSEIVHAVQECFADFIAINPDFFTLGFENRHQTIWGHDPNVWDNAALVEASRGVFALLISMRKRPSIRYAANNQMAYSLAISIDKALAQEKDLSKLPRSDSPPLLLILDRRDDPVTPLLSQWTYQAMIHEILGMKDSRVQLMDDSKSKSETKEFVLMQSQDEFFKANMFVNFGDLGNNIQSFLSNFQLKNESSSKIESIGDMKRFVEEYPEFKQLAGNVKKHVEIVSELSRRVKVDGLLEASELEQSIICQDNHNADAKVSILASEISD